MDSSHRYGKSRRLIGTVFASLKHSGEFWEMLDGGEGGGYPGDIGKYKEKQ